MITRTNDKNNLNISKQETKSSMMHKPTIVDLIIVLGLAFTS